MGNGDIIIEYVKPNSGCADACIQAGWLLISVDDRQVRGVKKKKNVISGDDRQVRGVKIMSRHSLHADMLY